MHPDAYRAKPQLLQAYNERLLEGWQELQLIQKPLIAAVNGYALGGGCEVAMMCDIIIASKTAAFGQVQAPGNMSSSYNSSRSCLSGHGVYAACFLSLLFMPVQCVCLSIRLALVYLPFKHIAFHSGNLLVTWEVYRASLMLSLPHCISVKSTDPVAKPMKFECSEGAFIQERTRKFKRMQLI